MHIAIGKGFDVTDRYQRQNPEAGAGAMTRWGVPMTYGSVSDASLLTARVDRHQQFALGTDSQMIIDTMVITQATGDHRHNRDANAGRYEC